MKKDEIEKRNEEDMKQKEGAENSDVSETQCYGTEWGKSRFLRTKGRRKIVFLQF